MLEQISPCVAMMPITDINRRKVVGRVKIKSARSNFLFFLQFYWLFFWLIGALYRAT